MSRQTHNETQPSKEKLLIEHAQYGEADELTDLIRRDMPNINYTDENGRTALHFAARNGHAGVGDGPKGAVDILIAKGADLNTKDKKNENSALHFAADGGFPDVIAALIAAGADVGAVDKDGNTALFHSIKMGDDVSAELLINAAENIDVQNKAGHTALHLACKLENEVVARKLLKAGADPRIADSGGFSAADYTEDNTELHSLINQFTDFKNVINDVVAGDLKFINHKNRDGDTPLQLAFKLEQWNDLGTLIGAGADVNIEDNDGKTIYDLIEGKNGFEKLEEFLLDIGAIPSSKVKEPDGETLSDRDRSNTI